LSANIDAKKQAQDLFQEGLRLLQHGQPTQADPLLQRAHTLDPENIDVLNLLGIRAYEKKQFDSALQFLGTANLKSPSSPHTLSNLGLVCNAAREYEKALAYLDAAIAINNLIPEIHNNRGNTLKALQQTDAAIKAFERAIALRTSYAEAFSNLGVIYLEQGLLESAITNFQKALSYKPQFVEAYSNLGNALTKSGNFESAFKAFEYAIQLRPNYLEAYLNFGASLKQCKSYDGAIECYERAIEINPKFAQAFFDLGELYYEIGEAKKARECYEKVLTLNPHFREAKFALAIAQIPKVYQCIDEIKEARDGFTEQLDALENDPSRSSHTQEIEKCISRHPFYLAYQIQNNRDLLKRFGDICIREAEPLQQVLDTKKVPKKDHSKKRIGIVSGFFSDHPVWHAITKAWVTQLDAEKFEIYLFSTNPKEDAETKIALSKAAHYFTGNSISEMANIIHEQGIDILLFPEVGMDPISKGLACLRLAPTQMASWGHPETTGLKTIDFYLSAENFEGADAQANYSEQLIQLPGLGTYVETDSTKPSYFDGAQYGIDFSGPVLICAGSPSKYSPENDGIFIHIATQKPNCQFVFFDFQNNLTQTLHARLKTAFNDANLDAGQFIRLIPFLGKSDFYGLMQKADLYLDTIGFSGFNTAIQSMHCGLPIVTMEGQFMRGRLASGLLNKLNQHSLIAQNTGHYVLATINSLGAQKLISKTSVILCCSNAPIQSLEQHLILAKDP